MKKENEEKWKGKACVRERERERGNSGYGCFNVSGKNSLKAERLTKTYFYIKVHPIHVSMVIQVRALMLKPLGPMRSERT